MKAGLRWWCAALALTPMLFAQTTATPKTKKKTAAARTAVTLKDVQELKDALAAQQQQIEQMKQEMQARDAALQQAEQQRLQSLQQLQQAQATAAEAQQKAASAETAANQQRDTVSQLSSDMADVKTSLTSGATTIQDDQKRMAAIEGLAGRFRFSGDVRVRGESFFQDCAACIDRNRARVRARFGFDGKLSEDFVGGIYIATGSLGDPTTTNTTFTNFFDRKTIGLDKAFITYQPVAHKWLQITGGKFAYTWNRTSVTFDPDLNPEGFSEKASWDLHTPILKNFTIGLMQMMFNEASTASDSYALGGQGSARLQIGPLTTTPSFTLIKWNNPSAVLQASGFAVQANKIGNTTTGTINAGGEGPGCAGGSAGSTALPSFPNCAFGPNGMTNAIFTDSSGKPRFRSGFLYADFILNNQVKTHITRLPLNLLLEYEDNLDASDHPLASDGVTVRTDLGSQSHAYLADISLGQTKNKNDVQFGYAWVRQEQDSVISSFNESDQRAPTNILQHRVYGLWKVRPNTVAAFTWWHGRTLNPFLQNAVKASGVTLVAGESEPSLNRYQFDLIYTF